MQSGAVLGNYELECLIGRGGGGEVYRAVQRGVGGFTRTVAIKLMHEAAEISTTSLQKLAREARIIGRLQHRNIVQVYEVGEAAGTYFLAMELVDGLTLKELILARGGELPFWLGIHVGVEVCRALDYAHKAEDERGQPLGIVHRDVKPSNILLNRQGDVKLSDFGLAKASLVQADQLTAHGIVKGTPAYMAPEQRAGLPATAASDVFALAIAIYEVCIGRRPALAGRVVVPPAPLSMREAAIKPEDEAVLLAALSTEPQLRPGAAALGHALTSMLGAVRAGERMLRVDDDTASWVSGVMSAQIRVEEKDGEGRRSPVGASVTRISGRSEETTVRHDALVDRAEVTERSEQPTRVLPHPRPEAGAAARQPATEGPVAAPAAAHERLAHAALRAEASAPRTDIADLAGAEDPEPSTAAQAPLPQSEPFAGEMLAVQPREPRPAESLEARQTRVLSAAGGGEGGGEATVQSKAAAEAMPAAASRHLEYAYDAQRTQWRIAVLVLLGIILVLGFVAWKERLIDWPWRREARAPASRVAPAPISTTEDAGKIESEQPEEVP